MNRLREKHKGFRFCRSVTTRDKRPGEIEGVSYFFVTDTEFDRMDKNGELIESITYLGNKYGTRYDEIDNAIENGENLVMILEAHGMHQITKHYKQDCLCVFVFPPSMKELENRIRSRGRESEEQLQERLSNARIEISTAKDYDYFVVNKDVDTCADEIYKLVKGETVNES